MSTGIQQDVDLDKRFIDVAAYNQRIMGPSHVYNAVDEAIRTALGYHTVAHITIPNDIQEWTSSEGERSKMNIKEHSAKYKLLDSDAIISSDSGSIATWSAR